MTQKLFTKNFILLILGQASSLFGNFILKLALSMYVLEKTGSAAVFAAILSAATIPTILFSPLGGIVADRANKKNIMVALDALTAFSIFCTTLFLEQNNNITAIAVLLVTLSIFGAFETPTVQCCIPIMLTGDNITKANAIVNQIASLSYFIAPMLGSILYITFGLKFVMYSSILFFFITALLECFIELKPCYNTQCNNIFSIIKQDFNCSMKYILKEQKSILYMLIFTAFCRFFIMGIITIGLPYVVCTILELNAKYYGAAESTLAVATILGSIIAGIFSEKLKTEKLYLLFSFIGIFIIVAGVVFIFPSSTIIKYVINIISFCCIQILISIFSIFAVSFIQQHTPIYIIGKIMAYTSAITLCVQPIGQIIYGFLFDKYMVYIIFISTGIIVCIIGFLAAKFFKNL